MHIIFLNQIHCLLDIAAALIAQTLRLDLRGLLQQCTEYRPAATQLTGFVFASGFQQLRKRGLRARYAGLYMQRQHGTIGGQIQSVEFRKQHISFQLNPMDGQCFILFRNDLVNLIGEQYENRPGCDRIRAVADTYRTDAACHIMYDIVGAKDRTIRIL